MPDPVVHSSDPEASAPESVDSIEPKPSKSARRTARKQAAKIALESAKRNLRVHAALVRVQLNAGDENATLAISKALLVAFLQTAFASLSGCKVISHTTDQVVARLRVANLIDSAAMTAIVAAMAATDSPASASLYLRALDVLAFGPESESDKARRSRRRRILREGERIGRSFDADPFPEVTRESVAAMPVELVPGFSHRVCIERVDDAAVHYGVGRLFEDTSDDLRSLANLVIGLQKGLPAGYRLQGENVDPVTLQTVRVVESIVPQLAH